MVGRPASPVECAFDRGRTIRKVCEGLRIYSDIPEHSFAPDTFLIDDEKALEAECVRNRHLLIREQ